MSMILGEGSPWGGIQMMDPERRSASEHDHLSSYDADNVDPPEVWYSSKIRSSNIQAQDLIYSNGGFRCEPTELLSGTHGFPVVSDQLWIDQCDAATNWAQIGTWTTAPATVDDNRIEQGFCLQGRNSGTVQGFSGVIMPRADAVWQYQPSTRTYIDIARAFNNSTAADTTPWPASEVAGDQMMVGWAHPIGGIVFTLSTSGVGGTLTWKYWNGSTWTAFSGVSDGTTGLTAAGTVTWTMPTDWQPTRINAHSGQPKLFYLVAEVATTYSTNPVITQGLLLLNTTSQDRAIYFWICDACPASTDTFSQGGLRLTSSSDLTPTLSGTWPSAGPTNSKTWYLTGSDGLRVGGFVPYVVDPTASGSLTIGSPTANLRRIGLGIGMVSAIGATTTNIFWDAVRAGSGLVLQYGAAGSGISLSEILSWDYQPSAMFGVITNTGGVYYYAGKLYVGQSDQDLQTFFEDQNQVLIFRNVPVNTTFHEIRVIGISGNTSTFKLGFYSGGLASNGCTIRGASRVSSADPSPRISVWTLTASNSFAVTQLYASTFTEMYRMSLNSASEVRSCTFQNFGDITPNGALFDDCTFRDLGTISPISATYGVKVLTTVATLTNCTFVNCATALLWNVSSDTDGKLDNTKFTSGGLGHAIELGSSSATTLAFKGITFTGYGADGTTNAALYNNSGTAITINVSNGGSTPTVRNGAGSSTTVNNSFSFTVSGLIAGSEVRIFRASDDVELAGIETSGTSFVYNYNYVSDVAVYTVIQKLDYQWVKYNNTLSGANSSRAASQRLDRDYANS